MKFLKKNKLIIIIVILCVGFFALINYTGKKDKSDVFSNGVGVILNPVQKGLYKVNSKIRDTFNFVFNYGKVKEDNKILIEENNKLKSKLIEYEDLKSQNIRLKKMLDYKEDKDDYNYVGCDIVGRVGNSYLEGYAINKGTKDGIKKRMVAITSEGLVGQVTSVGTNWAIVQVLGNENISVAAFNQRSKENNGIVKGYKDSGNNVLARIEMSNLEADIKEGDNILTSGLEIYPKGLTIGKIIKVEEDKGQFIKYGIIKPAVNMNKLEELFIVVPKEKREIKY